MMTIDKVVSLLETPKELLRLCHLTVFGEKYNDTDLGACGGNAPIRTFKVEIHDNLSALGFTTGISGMFFRQKDRPAFKLLMQKETTDNPRSPLFNAYYIPMVQTSDINHKTSHYVLPGSMFGGPNIMLTSHMSGCSFGVGSDADNATLVSHMKPNNELDKKERPGDLKKKMKSGFEELGGTQGKVLSQGHSYSHMGTVMGKRIGNKWTFYLQAQKTGAKCRIIRNLEVID